MSLENVVDFDQVLNFWFGDVATDGAVAPHIAKQWWMKDAKFDHEIRRRFAATHEAACAGALQPWAKVPTGRLALILVLDQFSRNLFRNDPRAFSQDPVAVSQALAALEAGEDQALAPVQRIFLVMPLMHAEDLALQDRCVYYFTKFVEKAPLNLVSMLRSNLDFAKQHRDIVARFGRFPHRNSVLGRTSTPEEVEFLKQPNSSF